MSIITGLRDKAESLILPTALADERRQAREEVIRSERFAAARAAEKEAIARGWDVAGPTPDPEWQAWLDRLAPRDGDTPDPTGKRPRRSWLKLVWQPGFPWHPIERWVICQMHEREAIPDPVIKHLEGPDPRALGYLHPKHGWLTTACVTRLQWDLYQQTRRELGAGCYASTFWIIQGDHGGHKAKMTHAEMTLSVAMGGPKEMPAPGDLPFAPFDNRVRRKLEQLHEVDIWQKCLVYGERRKHELDEADRKGAEAARALLWDWLGEQVMPDADRMAHAIRKDWSTADLPTTRGSLTADVESAREEFITED